MMNFRLLALAAAFAGVNGQDFETWCPNLVSDMSNCRSTYLTGQSALQNSLSSFYAVLSINTLITNSDPTFCDSAPKAAMLGYYNCVYTKLAACVPTEWQNTSPTQAQATGAIEYMCANLANLDVPCMREKVTPLVDCLKTAASKTTLPSSYTTAALYTEYQCLAFPIYRTCLQSTYSSCTKNTAALLVDAVDRFQQIKACDSCFIKPSLFLLLLSVFAGGLSRLC